MWATMVDTSRELREIPERLIRDAGIKETMQDMRTITSQLKDEIEVPFKPGLPSGVSEPASGNNIQKEEK